MPLDHTDPVPTPVYRPEPLPSGGRALVVVAALVIGLLAGFAGGFFVGQQGDPIPAPRSAAEAVAPAPTTTPQPQTYTEAATEPEIEPEATTTSARPAVSEPVGRASSGAPGGTDKDRPAPVVVERDAGSLQVASRPSGAQVFVDDVRVGVTPVSLADVSAGSHRVRIELPGFRRWATSVHVEGGARARVGASLER